MGAGYQATAYHKDIGQYLVRPMLVGDKVLPVPVPPARGDTDTRLAALTLLALCAGAVAWLVRWGG